MAKKSSKKVTNVREHQLHVPVSNKNPTGVTIRDQHLRRLKGTYLDLNEIEEIFKNYDRKNILYPTRGKLIQPNSDKYDEIIASESDFEEDPKNPLATGIAQITPETFKIVQEVDGEVKDLIFKGIRKKDLKNPSVAFPIAVRWLSRKKRLAEGKLGRAATAEEIIPEYKGLLKSKSPYKKNALDKFRKECDLLKKKWFGYLHSYNSTIWMYDFI